MVLSTHSDDEILFLGGVLAEYSGKADVQVLYFFDYTTTWKVREHEKLDGLWEIGIRNYPDKGDFAEQSVNNLEHTMQIYNYPEALGWLVEKIRKYQPLVCVTQDVNGEYGQPHHLMVVKMMMDAVNITEDETQYIDSVEKYGTYEVPKTYLHLWKENTIKLDTRKPLEEFNGKTAFEVANEGFRCHRSQLSDWTMQNGGDYDNSLFGLWRTNVGQDLKGDDLFENIAVAAQP